MWWREWWSQVGTCGAWSTCSVCKQGLLLRFWIGSPGGRLNSDSDEEVIAKVMAEVLVVGEIAGESMQTENKRELWKAINSREHSGSRHEQKTKSPRKGFLRRKEPPKRMGSRKWRAWWQPLSLPVGQVFPMLPVTLQQPHVDDIAMHPVEKETDIPRG